MVELGEVHDYSDLIVIARARMQQLGITFATLDDCAGVQPGYSAKLLAPRPSRRFGPVSFRSVFEALGLRLMVVEDPAALARIEYRLLKRKRAVQSQVQEHQATLAAPPAE